MENRLKPPVNHRKKSLSRTRNVNSYARCPMRSCPSSTRTRSRKRAVVRHAEIVLDGRSRRSKVVPEPTARFPGVAKRRRREDRTDRIGRGGEFRRWCRRVCVYVGHVALATLCVLSSPGDDADKWRVAPFGHATPNWRYRDVTCCASVVCMSLADFSLHATAWRRYSLNVRVSACNPPCF